VSDETWCRSEVRRTYWMSGPRSLPDRSGQALGADEGGYVSSCALQASRGDARLHGRAELCSQSRSAPVPRPEREPARRRWRRLHASISKSVVALGEPLARRDRGLGPNPSLRLQQTGVGWAGARWLPPTPPQSAPSTARSRPRCRSSLRVPLRRRSWSTPLRTDPPGSGVGVARRPSPPGGCAARGAGRHRAAAFRLTGGGEPTAGVAAGRRRLLAS
jgi:hypothetical protein